MSTPPLFCTMYMKNEFCKKSKPFYKCQPYKPKKNTHIFKLKPKVSILYNIQKSNVAPSYISVLCT